jgi:hypothetical protein
MPYGPCLTPGEPGVAGGGGGGGFATSGNVGGMPGVGTATPTNLASGLLSSGGLGTGGLPQAKRACTQILIVYVCAGVPFVAPAFGATMTSASIKGYAWVNATSWAGTAFSVGRTLLSGYVVVKAVTDEEFRHDMMALEAGGIPVFRAAADDLVAVGRGGYRLVHSMIPPARAPATGLIPRGWGTQGNRGSILIPRASPRASVSATRTRVMANISESKAARASSNIDVLFAKEAQLRAGYGVDAWSMTLVPKGSVVYGGIPGQTAFYTDAATVVGSGGSRTTLFQSLQAAPSATYGYRPAMRMYEVMSDIRVPAGTALNNPALGPGGGGQFYFRNYSSYLRGLGRIPLAE